jgi:phosphopentomutase
MRAMLLVLDGTGVGAMDDVAISRPQDANANTLLHVAQAVGGLQTPTLAALGLGHIQSASGLETDQPPLASYGQAYLAYHGADSYLGHQELLGTIPIASQPTLMRDTADLIEQVLCRARHTVRRLPGSMLVVDEAVVIADNLEADPGQNINLTVAFAHISFEDALKIGNIVRELVKVARVIVFGGPTLTLKEILYYVEQRPNGQTGVNSPALGVYDEKLMIRHMGYGVDPERQVSSILARAGKRVSLVGKMADLIVCPQAERNPVVPTQEVMNAMLDGLSRDTFDFMAVTVQETDLAGHEGDSQRFARVLAQADDGLAALLPLMHADDMLIVTADHGNDPTLRLGVHTRERVPVLVYRPGHPGRAFAIRTSLSDLPATIAAFFGVAVPQDGNPIQECLV